VASRVEHPGRTQTESTPSAPLLARAEPTPINRPARHLEAAKHAVDPWDDQRVAELFVRAAETRAVAKQLRQRSLESRTTASVNNSDAPRMAP
jgi:hypothetical protein